MTQLPELPTKSSNLLLKVLPCGLLFRVLSFWGYSREYARAYGSTLIFSELLPATVAYYYPQLLFDHSVILVSRCDTTLMCMSECIRVRKHT